MTLYFAYGSNMDAAQIKERCPESKFLCVGILKDYRIAFTTFSSRRNSMCADVVKSSGSSVWGILYELNDLDLKRLDDHEGYPYKYTRFKDVVRDARGIERYAEIYTVVVKNMEGAKPSTDYLDLIINSARKYSFSQEYIQFLETFKSIKSP